MTTILLVSAESKVLSGLASALMRSAGIEICRADSGKKAFNMISDKTVDLVVVDENIDEATGLEFVQKLVSINPLINTAVISSLSETDFHEQTEGLGVLMRLPTNPDEKQAAVLIERLDKVLALTRRN
jgi:YesN/AraC family two-component response regulator